MNSNIEDKDFKKLIKSTGLETAPDGILRSVLSQLEAEKLSQKPQSTSLIPGWIWISVIVLIVGIFINTFILNSSNPEFILLSELLQKMSFLKIEFNLLERVNLFEGMPAFFYVLIPAFAIQFYLIKNYLEGKYLSVN